MFSHKAFLKLGDSVETDFLSLIKSGYELASCTYSFQQGVDEKGKVSTEVFGGIIQITLSMLPPNIIIEWALNSRKYKSGVIVILDNENIPQERLIFNNAACVKMEIDYTQRGGTYIFTKMELRAEHMIVGSGIEFDNNWIK